jgi:hypothetical protein
MKNLKKILLVTVSTAAIVASSIAAEMTSDKLPVVSDLKVNISGYADFQAGLRNQNHLVGVEKNVSENRKGFAFYNSAAIVANVSNKVNEVEYGGKIVLVPTAKRKGSPNYNGSHIYMESDFGRIEAGSPFSASSTMMIDGSSIAAGTFDDWARYVDFSVSHLMQTSPLDPSFATFAEFFLDSKLTTALDNRTYSSEPARSVAFYTPKFNVTEATKIQAGISYTPDSSNTGADNPDTHSSGVSTRTVNASVTPTSTAISHFKIDSTVKDALSGAIAIDQNISDGVDFKLAISGEYGKAAGKAKQFTLKDNEVAAQEFKLSNLRTYNIGAILNVGNFSYAASFGSLGKSLTTPAFHKTGRKTDYYTGTVAYKQGPFAASVSYFKSDQFKNTVDAISIGTNYQLAPGFKPYAEISGFSLKGRPEFNNELEKKKTRGTVALIGAKLSL